MRQTLCAFSLVMLLTACSSTTQVSSGEEYLERQSLAATTGVNGKDEQNKTTTFADQLRAAASIEPTLKFPARIGIARINNGSPAIIPPLEATAWTSFSDSTGKEFGEFIQIHPMIANMFSDINHGNNSATSLNHTVAETLVDRIRLAAARLHLDAVMIYEAHSKRSTEDNIFSIGKLTVIGGFILPSKSTEAEGYATAILIDVMQAYPYGTVTAYADKETSYASAWGWSDKYGSETIEKIEADAVERLTAETGTMLEKLRKQLAEVQAKKQTKKISSKKK